MKHDLHAAALTFVPLMLAALAVVDTLAGHAGEPALPRAGGATTSNAGMPCAGGAALSGSSRALDAAEAALSGVWTPSRQRTPSSASPCASAATVLAAGR